MSTRIEAIYVAGWRGDLRFTQCCVASIRRWYPTIEICLIKDEIAGEYDTTTLERRFNVRLFDAPRKVFGWGISKLEPLFLPERRRILVLDSDVVFAGAVLDKLEKASEDFVVVQENHTPDAIKKDYFDPEVIQRLYPGYRFPGWVSNTGQFVATTGILRREDFRPFSMAAPLVLSKGGVGKNGKMELPVTVRTARELESGFPYGEQGLLNFVLHSKVQLGLITLRRMSFMRWPPGMRPEEIDVRRLASGPGYPLILHWAGAKAEAFDGLPLRDVLAYFEARYHQHAPW
jgi:hypothetical protein